MTRGMRRWRGCGEHVRSTFTPAVLTDIGSFSGMFSLAGLANLQDPVLVASMDGVGTKLKDRRDAGAA